MQNVVVEIVQSLRRLLDAWVLGGEAGDEDGVGAVWVPLGVDGALGEDGHLVLVEAVADQGGAVLEDVLGPQGALDDDVDLGGARVRVRGVEAAGTDEAEGHADAVAYQGREVLAVGLDGVPSVAGRDGRAERWVVEVVQVVAGVGEEVETVGGRRGLEEGVDQVLVAGAVRGDGDAGTETGRIQCDVC